MTPALTRLLEKLEPQFGHLADFSLQATLLMLGLLLMLYALPRCSASRRHLTVFFGILAIPALLGFSAILPAWQLPGTSANDPPPPSSFIPMAISSSIQLSTGPITPADRAPLKFRGTATESRQVENAESPAKSISWKGAVVAVWIFGVAGCLGWLALGAISLHMARKRCRPLKTGMVAKIFSDLLNSIPHLPKVRLYLSPDVRMPMTWGTLAPAIVLPDTAKDWPHSRVRNVLLHELGHIARRDCFANVLALASASLLWFHPLAWMLWKTLRREQESAADDWALQAEEGSAEAYADDLVQVVATVARRRSARPGFGLGLCLALEMAHRHASIKRRVTALLDSGRDRRPVDRRRMALGLPVWALFVACLAAMAACRSETGESSLTAGKPEANNSLQTRRFHLNQAQKEILLKEVLPLEDPFDPASENNERELDLKEAARGAKRKLQDIGVTFSPSNENSLDPEDSDGSLDMAIDWVTQNTPAVTFVNSGTMEVTALGSELDMVEEWLTDLTATSRKQVELGSHIFRVPVDIDIETLLGVAGKNVKPGLRIASGLNQEEGDVLLQRLKDNSMIKLVSTPTLITRSGQKAKIEQIREFIYPVEYDPPEVARPPENPKKPGANSPDAKGFVEGPFPITPATPTTFETRNIGTSFEFQPTILPGNRVDLEMSLEHVRFLGLVNYGTPIQTIVRVDGHPETVVLSENRMEQPVFETGRHASQITVDSGSYLLIIGLGSGSESDRASLSGVIENRRRPSANGEEAESDSQLLVLLQTRILVSN